MPDDATRALCALLTLREQVIAPLIAGVRNPGPGRPPATLTTIDRDYQHLRADMNALFAHLALTTQAPLAA